MARVVNTDDSNLDADGDGASGDRCRHRQKMPKGY